MFDGRRFLEEQFQRPQRVVDLFRFYDQGAPSKSAVEKWFQRGTIPGEFFPVLLSMLELEYGGPIGVSGYLKGRAE